LLFFIILATPLLRYHIINTALPNLIVWLCVCRAWPGC
jgi:hypothetical protein